MDEARKAITFVIPKHGVDTLVGWIRLRVAPGLYTTSNPVFQDFLRNYRGVTIHRVTDFVPSNSGTSAALPRPKNHQRWAIRGRRCRRYDQKPALTKENQKWSKCLIEIS